MTTKILTKFIEAWGDQNIDVIDSFFTNDCMYKASVGPEPGTTFKGKASVMRGVKDMMDHDAGGKAFVENVRVHENFGVYEWTYVFKDKSIILGCDLLEFEGDKIKLINAFRKTAV